MAQLFNMTKNRVIVEKVERADGMLLRMKGLLGRKTLGSNEALWIPMANGIHTWFMNFAIDAVFVDSKLRVKGLRKNIAPWKVVLPIWAARDVFEVAAGTIENKNIEVGDQLHVGH